MADIDCVSPAKLRAAAILELPTNHAVDPTSSNLRKLCDVGAYDDDPISLCMTRPL